MTIGLSTLKSSPGVFGDDVATSYLRLLDAQTFERASASDIPDVHDCASEAHGWPDTGGMDASNRAHTVLSSFQANEDEHIASVAALALTGAAHPVYVAGTTRPRASHVDRDARA